LCCKVGKVPFMYLGLSIGWDPRRLVFWELILRSINSRLSGWKSRFLFFEGHLVLLKSVLTFLNVYALFLFKTPSSIISSLNLFLIKKKLRGSEHHRKIPEINWNIVCLRKEYGELGVRRSSRGSLIMFN